VPLLPIGLLLLSGVVLWLVRTRPERVVWAVAVSGQWLVWLVLLGVHRFVPVEISLSIWRPSALFQTPLVLSLDSTGWTMAFALSSLLLAIGLTSAARQGSATPATRAFLSVYGALGMAAVLAGNLLTLAIVWAMMDVVAFSSSLVLVARRDIVPREIVRLSVQGTSILLLLAAAVLIGSGGGANAQLTRIWGYILGLASAAIRWGLFPAHYPLPSLPGIRRGLGTCLRLLPAAMGMVLITRLLHDAPPAGFSSAMAWAGGAAALVSGFVWALHDDPVRRRPMLVLGLASLAVCAAGAAPTESAASVALAGSASLLLIGAMASLVEPHEAWHRWWVVAAAFMILGGPWMPGQKVLGALVASQGSGPVPAIVMGLLGAVLLAVGVVRQVEVEPAPWPSGEDLVRASYVTGILVLLAAGIGVSLQEGARLDVRSLSAFLALGGASALAYYGLRRAGGRIVSWGGSLLRHIPSEGQRINPESVARAPLLGLLWVGDLIQGDAGLLWIMFLLLVLAAIVGRGP
jgi:hypothetical protein